MSANLQEQIVTRPILFSGPMVRALLDGRKTQTRRIVKAKDSDSSRCITLPMLMKNVNEWRLQDGRWFGIDGYDTLVFCDCPYGKPGDRIWVRETWCSPGGNQVGYAADGKCGALCGDGDGGEFFLEHGRIVESPGYRECFPASGAKSWGLEKYGGRWRPSIHMPRRFSRLTLEITGVRVERLNVISSADAEDEGVTLFGEDNRIGDETLYQAGFRKLWESINGEGSWAANPWVWVVEFKVV